MRKILINKCYGGFGLSYEAFIKLKELKHPLAVSEPDIGEPYEDGSICGGIQLDVYRELYPGKSEEEIINDVRNDCGWLRDIERDDPLLIQVFEDVGSEKCSQCLAELRIIEIPEDVDWEIQEYDGIEWIAEKHRTWH